MTQADYEQKRNELWYEYAAMLRRNCASRYVFDKIFDCAYTLGREKEAITREEIEKAAEKFADRIKIPPSTHGIMVPFINGLAHDAYLQGAQDFIGKQEKDAEEPKEKLMCLRDRTKVCNRCHACDIDTDAWYSMYNR